MLHELQFLLLFPLLLQLVSSMSSLKIAFKLTVEDVSGSILVLLLSTCDVFLFEFEFQLSLSALSLFDVLFVFLVSIVGDALSFCVLVLVLLPLLFF